MSKTTLVCIALAILALVAYANSLRNGFVYDDASVIQKNRYITNMKNITDIFFNEEYFARSGVGKYRRYGEGSYRPVVTVSYFIDAFFWKKNPFGYHAANVMYHIAYVIIIFFMVLALARNRAIAFISAVLVCVHPVTAEPVNAISFREDILCGIFLYLSFFYALRYAQTGHRNTTYLGICAVSYLLACLSKENGIVLPALIAGYALFADRRGKRFSLQLQRYSTLYITVAITALIYLSLRFVFFNFEVDAAPPVTAQLMLTRIIRFFNVIAYYLRILIVPDRLTPAFNEDFLQSGSLLLVSIPLFLLYCGLIYLHRNNGIRALGLSWFVITLLPTSGLLYLNQPVAERYLYVPMAGLALYAASFLLALIQKNRRFCSLIIVITLLYTSRTIAQNTVWLNEWNLWSYAIQYAPQDYNTVSNYAVALADANKYEQAVVYYKKAIALDDRAQTHYNLANTYAALGLRKKSEEELRLSIKKDPNYSEAHNNLARLLAESGRYEEAIEEIKIALALNPYNAKAYNNLGGCYNQLGQHEKAVEALSKALALSPGYISASFNLGTSYFKLGQYDKAIEMMEYVLRYEPGNTYALQYMESIKRQKSILDKFPDSSPQSSDTSSTPQPSAKPQTKEAPQVQHTKPVIQQPNTILHDTFTNRQDVKILLKRGDELMQTGHAAQALKMYRMAVNAQPSNPAIRIKLAECFMRLGSFEIAHKEITKALELDPDNQKARQRLSEIERVLKLPVQKNQ